MSQKKTKGTGLQLEAAVALATWKRETRRGRTCHMSNDGDSDWAHVLFARQSQYSSLRSYFTMMRMERYLSSSDLPECLQDNGWATESCN